MFNYIRYKIALNLIKKAEENVKKGDFKSVMKGLQYMKYSVMIVPPSKELSEFGKKMRATAEEQKTKFYNN